MMKWCALVLVLVLVSVAPTEAATINAASCSRADVASAISSASPGDIVHVPAGTCSWSGGLSISGIQLVGAGKSTSGTVITGGSVSMNKHSSQYTRVSGFRFTASGPHINVGGSASARMYIIDNNYFFTSGSIFLGIGPNGGLLHHNEFFTPPSSSGGPDALPIHPNEDWSQATTFGMADTQGPQGGERNIYFEDNTFTNILETAPDGDQGARLVIRYNTYVDSSIVFHSGSPNDTSIHGTRQFEVYNNTFRRVTCNDNLNKWIWVRGGSGVIANNQMDEINTSCFGSKVELRLGVGCPTSYPVPHQIGQTSASPQSPPPQPLLIFGNTGAGATGSWISIAANNTGGGGSTGCSNPSSYVQQNRDYFFNNAWGWTPYTYPHPLQNLSGGGGGNPTPPPAAPTALRIVN
jgi:hypothetical protein